MFYILKGYCVVWPYPKEMNNYKYSYEKESLTNYYQALSVEIWTFMQKKGRLRRVPVIFGQAL